MADLRIDAARVRQLRDALGWSQQELADAAQVDQSVVSRLERGESKNARFLSVVAVANALGVTVPELLEDAPAPDLLVLLKQAVAGLEQARRRAPATGLDGYPAEREEEIRDKLELLMKTHPRFAGQRLEEPNRPDRRLTLEELLSLINDEFREE